MAKVVGIHELDLKPGASADEFERFYREEVVPGPQLSGVQTSLLKGDRGVRNGKYLLLIEIDSQTVRDGHFPLEGDADADAQAYWGSAAVQHIFDHWGTLATAPGADTVWTDYVVVAPAR